jgi:uncharacterized protein YdiU (UPF0061 family)
MSDLFKNPLHTDFLSQLGHGSGIGFTTACSPTPLQAPHVAVFNNSLLQQWGLPSDNAQSKPSVVASVLGGNLPWPDTTVKSTASVYSGHQFGVWAGQLGDGRALMLGELVTPDGHVEIQLKGAGPTPYSRGGDGRAVLRSSIREYLCSEAMHGLGIPTTRALALVASPTTVRRDGSETTAVVTRTALSFLRFGHLEHFAHHGDHEALRTLVDALVERYFPELDGLVGNQRIARLLGKVAQRTATLMAQWQSVGFCHGVMNTDNMSLIGLTLDYGPFQFLDAYIPTHICNHSDSGGRYAFNQQPQMAYWNLHALAQALAPLMGNSTQAAEQLQQALAPYPNLFSTHYTLLLTNKLGLAAANTHPEDADLINDWMSLLASQGIDHTLAWRNLAASSQVAAPKPNEHPPAALSMLFNDMFPLHMWWARYIERLQLLTEPEQLGWGHRIKTTNPKYVLRNHLAQEAITAAQTGDWSVLHHLKTVLDTPFEEHHAFNEWASLPPAWAAGLSLSCSS